MDLEKRVDELEGLLKEVAAMVIEHRNNFNEVENILESLVKSNKAMADNMNKMQKEIEQLQKKKGIFG